MPFHVEIGSPIRFARAMNVEEDELRKAVLEPWVMGLPLTLGEQSWEPRESRLTILRGPALPASVSEDDEGWAVVLRAAEDVTRPMLEAAEASVPAQTAVVVEADSMEVALRGLGTGRTARQIPWATAVERIQARDAEVTGVVLVVKRSRLAWPTP